MLNEVQKQQLVELLVQADSSAEVVVLPERRLPNGAGVYHEAVTDVVKELKEEGVAVVWADVPERRAASSQRALDPATVTIILGVVSGVMTNATWEAIKLLFSTPPRASQELEVDLAKQTSADGDTWTWATFRGDGAAVAEAMDVYLKRTDETEQ